MAANSIYQLSDEDRRVLQEILKDALLALPGFVDDPREFYFGELNVAAEGVLASYEGWGQSPPVVAAEIVYRHIRWRNGGGFPAVRQLLWEVEQLAGPPHRRKLQDLRIGLGWRAPRQRKADVLPSFTERKFGDFVVQEKLGKGAFAVVYRATRSLANGNEEAVAVKILLDRGLKAKPELDLRNIGHPRVLQPEEHGTTEDGYTWFSMRLMKQTLRARMTEGQPIEWRKAVWLVLEIAKALVKLHEGGISGQGIIHQDLKPENILLDGDGNPHIGDLGLAVPLSERYEAEMRRRGAGTWPYMAPEVFKKFYHDRFPGPPDTREVTGQADIFSLGVILLEMLTGEAPWGGSLDARIASVNNPPIILKQKFSGVPQELENICLACLATSGGNRITSASGLVERIEALLPELRYLDLLLAKFRDEEKRRMSYSALEGSVEIRATSGDSLESGPGAGTDSADYEVYVCLLHEPAARHPEDREVRKTEMTDILQVFFKPEAVLRQAVLLGAPGSGKSTTLRQLFQVLAAKAQSDPEAPLPLFVDLRGWTGGESLEECVAAYVSKSVAGFGARIYKRGPCFFLLDEWNQVPVEGRGKRKLNLQAFSDLPAGSRIVVCCREADYKGELELGFDKLTLKPLTPSRILDTLRQWLKDSPGGADDLFWQLAGPKGLNGIFAKWREGGATLDEFFLFEKPQDHQGAYRITSGKDDEVWTKHVPVPHSLMKLASNPFMLWMLFRVWRERQDRKLPPNRGQLLAKFLDLLLHREHLLEYSRHQGRRVSPEGLQLLQGLENLAWGAFGLGTAGLAEFSREAALQALGTEELIEKALGATILEGSERVYFRHQLLQEYFAARALSGRLGEWKAEQLWPRDRWWVRNNREVTVVLMAGFEPEDCTRAVEWLADAQPEVAAQCIEESGAPAPGALRARLQTEWKRRLTGPGSDAQPEARAAIGRALGMLNLDDRPGVGLRSDGLPDIDFVTIAGGPFLYSEKNETKTVETFRIGRYPVTNVQFRAFVEAEDGYRIDGWWDGMDVQETDRTAVASWFPESNCPRENVNWFEATAFCRWLSQRLTQATGEKTEIRLPTEWEWERAVRGTEGRQFPWGSEYTDGDANISEDSHRLGRTSAVGIYPKGAREAGDPDDRMIHDLAGNVWEWCSNRYDAPFSTDPGGRGESRVLRGGAWYGNLVFARADFRSSILPNLRLDLIGFRVVCGVVVPHPPDAGPLNARDSARQAARDCVPCL